MVSITGLNIFPSANLPKVREPDAILLQGLNASNAESGAPERPASGAGTTTNAPTGFTAAPRLSADLIGALISSQSQQSTNDTSGNKTAAQATSLSGAAAVADQTTASSDPTSGPPTLQQIAAQFDLHHLTHNGSTA